MEHRPQKGNAFFYQRRSHENQSNQPFIVREPTMWSGVPIPARWFTECWNLAIGTPRHALQGIITEVKDCVWVITSWRHKLLFPKSFIQAQMQPLAVRQQIAEVGWVSARIGGHTFVLRNLKLHPANFTWPSHDCISGLSLSAMHLEERLQRCYHMCIHCLSGHSINTAAPLWVGEGGFWQDRRVQRNGAQLDGPRVSNFLSHRIVKSLTFRICSKLKFRCTRNGPQNPPLWPGWCTLRL